MSGCDLAVGRPIGSFTALTSVATGPSSLSVWAARLHTGRRTHPLEERACIQTAATPEDDFNVTRPFDVLARQRDGTWPRIWAVLADDEHLPQVTDGSPPPGVAWKPGPSWQGKPELY